MEQYNKMMEVWKKERTDAMSEMFDNVDEYGIYPTTKFFNRLDSVFHQSLLSWHKSEVERLDNERINWQQQNTYEDDESAVYKTTVNEIFADSIAYHQEIIKELENKNTEDKYKEYKEQEDLSNEMRERDNEIRGNNENV